MTIILHRRRRFNWQVFLMTMRGVAFLLVFAYAPMFGIAIAFKNMPWPTARPINMGDQEENIAIAPNPLAMHSCCTVSYTHLTLPTILLV